jgi:hypothetical protein
MEVSLVSKRRWLTAMVGLVVLTAIGCSGPKVTTKSSSELSRYQIRTIALVPFTTLTTPQAQDVGEPFIATPQNVRRSDISVAVPTNVEGQIKQTVTVPSYAADKITQLFWNRLKSRDGLVVLSPSDLAKASSGNADQAKATQEAVGAAIATRLKADAALVGQVLVFQERVGSRLGANPPASVGFEVKVVASDGIVLWSGNYYERQKPMTEDMLGFLQRWGAFVTADELAQYGVDEMLKTFPFGSPGK